VLATIHAEGSNVNAKANIHARANPRKISERRKHFSPPRKRLREIERIVTHRHGGVPETDDAELYLAPVANCFRMIAAERGRTASVEDFADQFSFWCQTWAVPAAFVGDIVRDEFARPLKLVPGEVLGKRLRLSYTERSSVKATTIGSYDVDRATRKRLTKARKRGKGQIRAEAKRRATGAVPRAIYEANSLSKTEPWKAEGISRSTWERRRKKAADASASPYQTHFDASPSPHLSSIERRRTCVTPISTQDALAQPTADERRAPKASRRRNGEMSFDGGVACARRLIKSGLASGSGLTGAGQSSNADTISA
jgi:hypothetical protein